MKMVRWPLPGADASLRAMTDLLYFSYGSNMLDSRLVARCPGAEPIGAAAAKGYSLDFSKRGKDQSGKATLVRAEPSAIVHGVVYRLCGPDVEQLDGFEGPGYERRPNFVVSRLEDGEKLDTFTYIAKSPEEGLKPFDWYVALILAGARQHGIDPAFLAKVDWTADPEPARPARLQALAALASVGVEDVAAFFEYTRLFHRGG